MANGLDLIVRGEVGVDNAVIVRTPFEDLVKARRAFAPEVEGVFLPLLLLTGVPLVVRVTKPHSFMGWMYRCWVSRETH